MKYPTIIDELDLLNPDRRMPDGAYTADYELMIFTARKELIEAETSAEKATWTKILKDLYQF